MSASIQTISPSRIHDLNPLRSPAHSPRGSIEELTNEMWAMQFASPEKEAIAKVEPDSPLYTFNQSKGKKRAYTSKSEPSAKRNIFK